MSKKCYKYIASSLSAILLVLFCFTAAIAAAAPSMQPDRLILSIHDYKITAYDIQVKVQEDHILEVTERITAHFDAPKHGLFRSIPLVHARVSNISVSDGETGQEIAAAKEKQSPNLLLKIGDSNKTVIGDKTYVIRYSYALDDDQFDVFNFGLIGDQWDTNIGNISFTIEMPKPFDPEKIIFRLGNKEAGKLVSYKVAGNFISGTVETVLGSGQGLTISLDLPEGYFISNTPTYERPLTCLIIILFMIVSLVLFFLFGRNLRVKVLSSLLLTTVNPAEVGYVLGGEAAKRGRTALLLHWAKQGYLNIETDEQGGMIFHKRKEADQAMKPYEITMFNALFRDRDKVVPEQFKDLFIGVMTKVEREIKDYFDHPAHRLQTVASDKARLLSYLLSFVSVGVVTKKMFGEIYNFTDALLIGLMTFSFSLFLVFPFILFIHYYVQKNGSGSPTGVMVNIIGLLCGLGLLLGLLSYSEAMNIESSLAVLAVGVCGLFGAFTTKRTQFGNELHCQVLAWKRQIERNSQETQQDIKDFYSQLPYAYVFGVAKQWAKGFERLELEPPNWFKGHLVNLLSTLYFTNWISESMNTCESNMINSSSSGDSGDSGGSGGSGGDGGGSW